MHLLFADSVAEQTIAELAQRNGAESELVDALRGVREVEGPNGVMKELKGDLGG